METQIKTIDKSAFETDKNQKLLFSIVFDLVGMATFLIPFLGEIGDLFWAPIAAYMMAKMYKGISGKMAGVLTFFEEIIPLTDFIPSFTLMWIYTFIIKAEKGERN